MSTPALRTARSLPRLVTLGLLVLVAAVAVPVSQQILGSTSSTITTPFDALLGGGKDDALGEEGGVVPDGVTVFDDDYPAVANLDSKLLDALRDAARDAADDGITMYVNSGWRSSAYQLQLLDDAVSEYGSREEASRWVATPERSAHVSGDAVDIGGRGAAPWLSEHGAKYGLCRIYDNEPWHFERRAQAVDIGCPQRYADPTQDPRMLA